MKLSFSLTVKDDGGAQRLLESIRAAGFDGVEPTFVPEGTLPTAADPRGSAEKFRKLADQVGLKIPSMRGGPGFWTTFASDDAEKRCSAVKLAEKAFEALAIMGGDTLLIVPGQWDAALRHCQVWDAALDTAKRIGERAERAGITVALENVDNRFLLSPREWMQFLDQVGSRHVRMYFDVGNVVYLGLGYPDQWLLGLGKRYIKRIHIKDARRGVVLPLREGDVDWKVVAPALRFAAEWIGIELELPAEGAEHFLAQQNKIARELLHVDHEVLV